MKQLLTLFISIIIFSSCGSKDKDKTPVFIQPQLLDTIFSSSYEGIIPCPDCPGIETTIKIFNDSTISRTIYYQGKSELPQTKMGTWKIKDSIFEATFDRDKLFYKIKSGNIILRVGADLKEVQGKLADDYVLKRAKPFEIENYVGEYFMGNITENHNILNLREGKKNQILIELASFLENDTIAKCKLNFKGNINKENIIEVNIGKKDDSIQQLMKVLFTIKEAHVFFENVPKDSIAVKCKDSTSINYQGTYLKK